MKLGKFVTFALLLTLLGSVPALAQKRDRPKGHHTSYENEDLQITKLLCAIRDGNFLTFFQFRPQVIYDHPVMTGEISNYQVMSNGTRKYISGIIFTSIAANNTKITGDTGDPSDIIGRFVLTRLDVGYEGRWGYEFRRSETEVVRAVFNCSYSDTPPSERKRRWPNFSKYDY